MFMLCTFWCSSAALSSRNWIPYVNSLNCCRKSARHFGDCYKQMGEGNKNGVGSYKWYPGDLLTEEFTIAKGHACLVLNTRLSIPPPIVIRLWEFAELRCLVDGGTNRWKHFLTTSCPDKQLRPPDLITGDFDSITDESKKYFNDSITKRIHTPDQNATDFTKAIGVVRTILDEKKIHDIIVFQDTSGRFDQILGNINTLHKVQNTALNVYLLSGNSLIWLLRPGKHSIKIPQELIKQQRWCALIPIGKPANCVTTTGLKWNLNKSVMEFGGLVSTSNTYANECVQIETDAPLIWAMGLFSFDDEL